MAGPSQQPFISFSAFFELLLKLLVLKRPNPLSSSYCKWLWTWSSTHSSACVLWAVWQNKWKFCNKQKNSCRTAGILRKKKKSISGAESRTKNTGQHLGSGLKLFLYLLQSFCKMFLSVPAAQGHLTATVNLVLSHSPYMTWSKMLKDFSWQGNLWLSQLDPSGSCTP